MLTLFKVPIIFKVPCSYYIMYLICNKYNKTLLCFLLVHLILHLHVGITVSHRYPRYYYSMTSLKSRTTPERPS